uniref:siderophore ferric iron reductase n=1 Tax=Thaumasiovibrio occultus TaxID=1891184 RepID=UPI000B3592F2
MEAWGLDKSIASENRIDCHEGLARSTQSLYEQIATAFPEAGSAYWLTRTWELLCWQPIYTSMVAVYGCHGAPRLSDMSQQISGYFVTGFQLHSLEYHQGEVDALIDFAASEVSVLAEQYFTAMAQWTRIRPRFTQQLLADSVLSFMVRLSPYAREISAKDLQRQATLWLDALGLSQHLDTTLFIDKVAPEGIKPTAPSGKGEAEKTQWQLKHIRRSCCLVYK